MQTYNLRFAGTLEVSGLIPLLTLIAGAVRSLIITEIDIEGMATASASGELGIYRVGTAGVTPAGAITPVPTNAQFAAFTGTAFGSYSTNPLKGALVHNCPLNGNGQRYYWRAEPGLKNAIIVPGGNNALASLTLMTLSGTSAIAGRLQLAEF